MPLNRAGMTKFTMKNDKNVKEKFYDMPSFKNKIKQRDVK